MNSDGRIQSLYITIQHTPTLLKKRYYFKELYISIIIFKWLIINSQETGHDNPRLFYLNNLNYIQYFQRTYNIIYGTLTRNL